MKIIIALDCSEIQVSDCDHLFLSGYRWKAQYGHYNCSSSGTWNGHQIHGKPIHWFVAQLMGLRIPDGYTIDHIDRNPLNNQRSNLRVASKRLQSYNVGIMKNNISGFVGVTFNKKCTKNPWIAMISMPDGKYKYLGNFKTSEEASEAYQIEKKIRDTKEEEQVREELSFL